LIYLIHLRIELLVAALDALLAMSAFKEVALAFCQQVPTSVNESHQGIRLVSHFSSITKFSPNSGLSKSQPCFNVNPQ